MARMVTTTAVKRIISKGLTGWQAGKLVLQDTVDSFFGRDSVLTEADMAVIQQIRMAGADVRDYNTFMALCRGFGRGYMLAEWACKDACLQIIFLNQVLEDTEKRRMVELFESCGPHVVTRSQYEEIVAAQREKKLAFEFGLGYVIEERFYAIAQPEAKDDPEGNPTGNPFDDAESKSAPGDRFEKSENALTDDEQESCDESGKKAVSQINTTQTAQTTQKDSWNDAQPEARAAIEGAGVDIESVADFIAAVPEAYGDLCKQAIDQIRRLHTSGKLAVVYAQEDAREVKTLLRRWKKNTLSPEEAMELVDRLYVTGQSLYDCPGLPEWKAFVDKYQRHWFDDDERFRHVYAVLEDCPGVWLDRKGYYKGPMRPSEWITHSTESLLGLSCHDGKEGKSIERVGAELKDRLDTAKQNICMFLAVKAVLDAAVDAVGLDVPGGGGLLAGANMKLDAFMTLYNLRLEELREERRCSPSGETRLEKALQMLPSIDVDKLRPSPESLTQLKYRILDDARGEDWLRTKVRSVECTDGSRFMELMN